MLESIRRALEDFSGTTETDETLWRSTANPILRTRVQQYLYKSMHQTQMVGPKWTNIRGFRQRMDCAICHSLDTMNHILTQCQANTTRIPWELAKAAWPHRDAWWPNISLGIILGVGCINIPTRREDQNQRDQDQQHSHRCKAPTRLLRLLISETAHLVWVLRCERVIQNVPITDQQIRGRWLRAINDRLTCDRIIATKIKKDKKYTNLIKNTWEPLLHKQRDLPDNWINNREVLVGSGA